MKLFNDYINEELLLLTDDEIQTLIEVECMNQNIPVLPPEPVAPEIIKPAYDLNVYTVKNLIFTNVNDAQKVINLINSMKSLVISNFQKVGSAYFYTYDPVEDPVSIDSTQALSNSQFYKVKNALLATQIAKDTFNKDHEEWVTLYEARQTVSENIITKLTLRKIKFLTV